MSLSRKSQDKKNEMEQTKTLLDVLEIKDDHLEKVENELKSPKTRSEPVKKSGQSGVFRLSVFPPFELEDMHDIDLSSDQSKKEGEENKGDNKVPERDCCRIM